MILTRCDTCKKFSDESKEYIGKTWELKIFHETLADITTRKDICRDCLVKAVSLNNLVRSDD